jgi:aryl-alcohol dehydrogenase-like predicted oxidoreductase
VLIGARTLGQLDDNLASTGVVLSSEQLNELATVSRPTRDYPAAMLD